MPQLRQNSLTGDWVVIAPERAKRPTDYRTNQPSVTSTHEPCIFCDTGKVYQERIVELERETLYVVDNKYPAFVDDMANISERSHQHSDLLHRDRPAVGTHNVVILKDGNLRPGTFSNLVWQDLFETFRDRMLLLSERQHSEVVIPFYNHGSPAGASLDHPHAQVIASSFIPVQLRRELESSSIYHDHHQRCLLCDLIADERSFAQRVVLETEQFIVLTAFAARFPFETIVLPKRHADRFELVEPGELTELTTVLHTVFGRYDQLLNDPPLNFFVHSQPASLDRSDAYHWHIEVTPRLNTYGGFELASGVVIDIVSPEHAAAFLRGETTT